MGCCHDYCTCFRSKCIFCIKHEAKIGKMPKTSRATHKLSAGQMWIAGRVFGMPVLECGEQATLLERMSSFFNVNINFIILSVLICVHSSDTWTLFYFNLPKCVCASRNLNLFIFSVILWKLGVVGQSVECKSKIKSSYQRIWSTPSLCG